MAKFINVNSMIINTDKVSYAAIVKDDNGVRYTGLYNILVVFDNKNVFEYVSGVSEDEAKEKMQQLKALLNQEYYDDYSDTIVDGHDYAEGTE